MKYSHSALFGAACTLLLLAVGAARAAELKLPASDASPAELVTAALRTELEGPSDQRKTLLDQALTLDPDFAPARWQSGFVRWDDQWLTLEEVADRAGEDKRLAAYRQRRDAMIDRADDHREMARWCKKNELTDHALIHWAKVLEFNPQDAESLQALGLEWHNGQLLTKQQIVDAKKQSGQRLQAIKRWQPTAVKWRKAIESGSGKAYDAARAELRELNDAQAIPALELVFAENGAGTKADAINLVLIETIGRMQTPEATPVLIRRAIVPESKAVREAAATQLRERPLYAFVPILLSLVPEKVDVETEFSVFLAAGSWAATHTHSIVVRTPTRYQRFQLYTAYTSMLDETGNTRPGIIVALGRVERLNTQIAATLALEQSAQAFQEHCDRVCSEMTERVRFALDHSTDLDVAGSYEDWCHSWDEHQEIYRVEQPGNAWQEYADSYFSKWVNVSCFPPGTQVLTATGQTAIETIKVGDSVVAQDPSTGELTRGFVQATTLRPAAPLVKITLGAHILSATRGHPFWVNGQGWTMAKHLKAGQILHGIDGAQRIDAIEEAPPREAYNLVVGNYGTYFVGEQPVLVHDNSPLAETTTVVPGLDIAAAP
jgi:tetratricopeptide (TPR) repeat protein